MKGERSVLEESFSLFRASKNISLVFFLRKNLCYLQKECVRCIYIYIYIHINIFICKLLQNERK